MKYPIRFLPDIAGRGRSLNAICLLAALTCLALAPSETGLAQGTETRELTFRGFHFDPINFQEAKSQDWLAAGISPEFQAGEPQAGAAHLRILQFSRPFSLDDRRALKNEGLQLDVYLGGGYIEFVTLATIERLVASRILRASVPYHPAFKLAPSLGSDRKRRLAKDFETKERQEIPGLYLRAMLFPNADPIDTANKIRAIGNVRGIVIRDNRRFGSPAQIVFSLEKEADLAAAAHVSGIRSLEEVGEIISDNVGAARTNQSGSSTSATIWNAGLTGKGQVLGILEDGIPDVSHCFFNDPGTENNIAGSGHRKLLEIRDASLVSGNIDHATFVAGNAAGDDFNFPGSHAQRGGAWAAKLVLGNWHDIYEVNFFPNEAPSTLTQELNTAGQLAFIHSNSWHDEILLAGYSGRAIEVDAFSRINEDHLVLGSSGPGAGLWGPPAIAKNALSVSAADYGNPMLFGSGFSGPTPSARRKPDLVAVGCNISSAKANTSCGIVTRNVCATSYSTPHAAALVALARQYYVDGWYPSGAPNTSDSRLPTGSLLKATLINAARDMTEEPVTPAFPSQREGWGVVTLDQTLYFPGSDRKLHVWDIRHSNEAALVTGEQETHHLVVNDSGRPLKVTLVWADYPGESFDGCLINNLDLEVIAPDGETTYLGNAFDMTIGRSVTGGSADSINNVEQVIVDSPEIGKWTLRIKGYNVEFPGTDSGLKGQGYALVATTSVAAIRPQPPNL